MFDIAKYFGNCLLQVLEIFSSIPQEEYQIAINLLKDSFDIKKANLTNKLSELEKGFQNCRDQLIVKLFS